MLDGSDAIADWPILNALLNTAAGATWVSVHHGGGVGIGNSIHAGMVVVADGTDDGGRAARARAHRRPGHRRACATPTRATRRRSRPRASTGSTCRRALPPGDERGRRSPARGARLLVRDLAQVVTPAGAAAPLRGAALGEVDVHRRTRYVLCEDGRDRRRRARCASSRRSRRRRRGARRSRALRASRGSSTATRTPASRGDRVDEFALRARRRELRGAARGRRRHPRPPCARPGRPGEDGLAARSTRHRGWMLAHGHDDVRGEVRLRARPRHRARVAARDRGRGRRADLARRPRRPARVRRRGRVPRLRARARCSPTRRGSPRRPTSSSSGARSTSTQARRYLEACRGAGLALRLHGDQFTESGAIPLAVELGARSVDHLEATGADGVARWRRATSTAVLLPASALFLGRPMPPGRALVDAGAAVALATDFNPGSAFCESLPLVCSLACTQLGSRRPRRSPHAPSTRRTCSAAQTGSVGSRPASTPISSSWTRRTGATSPTTWAEPSSGR